MATMTMKMDELLKARFPDAQWQIIDDSSKHRGHAGARPGGESHFTLQLTSVEFEGQSRVARHRMVYAVLQPLFAEGLHALAIEAKTPKEAAN